jgi:hypothetical protein
MGKQQPVMAVTSESMDDIGRVLSGLGLVWSNYCDEMLQGNSKPDVVFVNCGSPTSNPHLKYFVEQGGVVYISDHSYTDVELLLEPKSAHFSLTGLQGTYAADVIDQNLRTFLGTERIELEFDMGSWAKIETPPPKSNSLLKINGKPVLITGDIGKGSFIFTSFHNSAQKSELEKKLIQYLALKPLLRATTIKTVKETTTRGGPVEILKQMEPVLSKQTEFTDSVLLDQPFSRFTAELSWIGDAKVTMNILHEGKVLKSETARMSPLRISLSAGKYASSEFLSEIKKLSVVISLDEYLEQTLLSSVVLSVEPKETADNLELKSLLGL